MKFFRDLGNIAGKSQIRVRAFASVFAVFFCFACKNVASPRGDGPKSPLDYSSVKFATYNAVNVLSAGKYTGQNTQADVVARAMQDVKNHSNCKAGSQRSFCTTAGGEAVEWIQLFLPDGSSCGVGKIPEGVEILPCLDNS